MSLAILVGGCATKTMRTQAAALASAGDRLEAETAAFSAARTAVVQLRQRSLVQRKQEVAEQGQYNARTLVQWRVAGSEERAKRLELFTGVVAGSEAMYEVRDQGLLWEESVLAARNALGIDRAALHRFVRQLLGLSRPLRFIDGVRFYVEYGDQVAAQVDADLADVRASVAAAQASKDRAPGGGPGGIPTPVPLPNPPPKLGTPPGDPRPRPPVIDTIVPGPKRDDPTRPSP